MIFVNGERRIPRFGRELSDSCKHFATVFINILKIQGQAADGAFVIAGAAYPLASVLPDVEVLIVSLFKISLFLTARTSPITHVKAAIDCAVFGIYLANSPLGTVRYLL